jgi:hypothetical protein
MNHSTYMSEEIQKNLIGAKITSSLLDEESDSFGFVATKDETTFYVWVDCDPEGNGCGHLKIEAV